MVSGCVITEEYAVPVSADRMWKVALSGDRKDAMPKACAGYIDAVDIEGDGGPGTVTTMTLSPAAVEATGAVVMKSRVVSRDSAARFIRSEMLEGGKVSAKLKSQVTEARIEEAGEGACVIKAKVEYESLDGGALAPEEQAALMGGYMGLMKMIEAYLVANPAEYA